MSHSDNASVETELKWQTSVNEAHYIPYPGLKKSHHLCSVLGNSESQCTARVTSGIRRNQTCLETSNRDDNIGVLVLLGRLLPTHAKYNLQMF